MITRGFRKAPIALLLSLMTAGVTYSSQADSAKVTVDLSSQLFIGDTSELQRDKFFNLHSSAGESGLAEIDLLYIKNQLNADYGRIFFGPLGASNGVNYPSTETAMVDGPIAIQNANARISAPFSSNRTVVTEQPDPYLRDGNDPTDGARWAADYFQYYFDDNSRPLFFEPMNEPFVHADEFTPGGFGNPEGLIATRAYMTRWFREIGEEFDNRGLETNVIGFADAFPSFEVRNFDNWDSRMKMFIDDAGESMDALSVHLYDGVNIQGESTQRSGSNAEAILDIMESYSQIRLGKVLPHAVTEYGGIFVDIEEYTPERWSEELPSYNRILFSLLDRENRLMTSTPFATTIASFFFQQTGSFTPFSANIFRPDPEKINNGKINDYLLTEKVKFYLLWADVKGNRVDVEGNDPDVGIHAFASGTKLYVALSNFEDDTSKEVELDFLGTASTLNNVRVKRLNVPQGQAAIFTDNLINEAPATITLAKRETVVLEYNYAEPIEHQSVVREQNYYPDLYLQPIVADSTLSFSFNGVEIDQNELSFADSLAQDIEFDQAVVDAINPNSIRRFASIMRSYDRSFARVLQQYPDTWQQSADYQRLVARAERSAATQEALQYHYSQNGYNDGQGEVTLRMGIGRQHDKSKQPIVTVNGHQVAVPTDWKGYDQINRSEFFGAIEIPVEAKYLKTNNQVNFTFPDTQGHLSSVILDVETREDISFVAETDVSLGAADLAINKDISYRLSAEVLPVNATNKFVFWVSSNLATATINDNGLITPVAPGFATITATTTNGKTATIELEVRDKETVRNTVGITTEIIPFDPTNSFTINVAYSTDEERDVAFELNGPRADGSAGFLGQVQTTVPAGEGEVELTLNFDQDLVPGFTYRAIAGLRQVGGNFTTNVDSHSIRNIEVIGPLVDDPTNLFGINSGFELGTQPSPSGQTTTESGDWELAFVPTGPITQDEVQVSIDARIEGRYGLAVDATNRQVGFLLNDKRVLPRGLIKPGKKYKISFDVKRFAQEGEEGFIGGFMQFAFFQPGDFRVGSNQLFFSAPGDGQTTRIEREVEITADFPDSGNFVQFFFQAGKWNVDNFRLEDITPEEPDRNIIVRNAGFELGDLTDWAVPFFPEPERGTLTVSTEAARSGAFGLKVDTTVGRTGLQLNGSVLPEGYFRAGTQYKVSMDIRRTGGGNGGMFTNFFTVDGGFSATPQRFFGFGSPLNTWVPVEILVDGQDLSATATNLQIVFQSTGLQWDVDNISIEEVVQP